MKGRKKTNLTTLCYLERDGAYLMMHRVKKAHDINHDKWVGVGGHFEPDESPEECLLREVREEAGVVLDRYRLRGVITFSSDAWQTEYMFLYTADVWHGELAGPEDCDEGPRLGEEGGGLPPAPLGGGQDLLPPARGGAAVLLAEAAV